MDLQELLDEILAFRDERDWAQFHTPQQLAAAISIEAAELQELFLWKDDEEAAVALEDREIQWEAAYEVADILIFALLFCDAIAVDPAEVVLAKLEENERKYPIDQSRGRANKYTDL